MFPVWTFGSFLLEQLERHAKPFLLECLKGKLQESKIKRRFRYGRTTKTKKGGGG